MALQPGDKLGPYEILSPIGEGGMGEVWKARDTKLKRDVAKLQAVSGPRFSHFLLKAFVSRVRSRPCYA